MANSRVLVADADSTDATRDIVLSFRDRLRVEVVPGGMPSVGRNSGARLADTKYVLFLDADIELATDSLIRKAVDAALSKDLQCVTTNVLCPSGSVTDQIFYAANDFFQYLSCLHRPYSTGMFMLFELAQFRELGGFDERVHFAEDYRLSSQVKRRKFKIVRGGVYTTNRRFQRMGHWRMAGLFLWTALNFWNEDHFLRDHHYWVEGGKS
jgi:glycosyltransferase involved in cell wall biosynthesis